MFECQITLVIGKIESSSSNATNLAAASIDNDTDSISDQDVHVVLTGIPNHSFLSPQALQGDILDDDDNKEDDNDDNNDDNYFGMEYNATVYDGRENYVAAVHQARLSADRKSTRLNSSHPSISRMPSSA